MAEFHPREGRRVSPAVRAPETHAARAVPTVDAGDVVDLQRLIGNQGVQRLLADNPGFVQAKLTVGAADDSYEQEADAVASQVMRQAESAPVQRAAEEDELNLKRLPSIQRGILLEDNEPGGDQVDELALKRIQRAGLGEEDPMAIQDEEGSMQMKRAGDIMRASSEEQVDMSGSFDVTSDIESQISSSNGSGQTMPDQAQDFFQSGFGHDFSNVNVHADSHADTLNRSLGARAFTTGSDIYFRSGEYNPGSSSGKELLAHELTHVVQQTGGNPVQPKRDEADA